MHQAPPRRAALPPQSRWLCVLAALACQLLVATAAQAYNKCKVDGKVVFQDTPCEEDRESQVQIDARRVRNAKLEHKLDMMQANASAAAQAPPARTNTESPEKQAFLLAQAKTGCGGEPAEKPKAGMSDEFLLNCTKPGLLGGISQVIKAEEGGIKLRLYVFSSGSPSRAYSIGGIITTVTP